MRIPRWLRNGPQVRRTIRHEPARRCLESPGDLQGEEGAGRKGKRIRRRARRGEGGGIPATAIGTIRRSALGPRRPVKALSFIGSVAFRELLVVLIVFVLVELEFLAKLLVQHRRHLGPQDGDNKESQF